MDFYGKIDVNELLLTLTPSFCVVNVNFILRLRSHIKVITQLSTPEKGSHIGSASFIVVPVFPRNVRGAEYSKIVGVIVFNQ